jgi:hypothetical protein
LESLCSPESKQRFIIAIVELQRKIKRKHERNYGGGALSDALSGSGKLIAKKIGVKLSSSVRGLMKCVEHKNKHKGALHCG